MARSVLVLGGYGYIGLSIVKGLIEEGHNVVALGRDLERGRASEKRSRWIAADIAKLTSPSDWEPHLSGIDCVVNASGALQSGLKDDLPKLQDKAIRSLVSACESLGIRTFIQISAPGVAADSSTEFYRTKHVADEHLRQSSLDWFILKPGLVISSNAYGGTALIRMLAAFPVVLPVVYGSSRLATVHIDDVTGIVSKAVSGDIEKRNEIEIAEADPATLKDIVLAFRSWLGLPKPLAVIDLPEWIAKTVGFGADLLGHLGWRSPLRSTAIAVTSEDVMVDTHAYRKATGRELRTLQQTLDSLPATTQERWFASLYLLMPVLLAALSAFWLVSGLIGFAQLDRAAVVLTDAGFSRSLAMTSVIVGSVIDVALGLAVLYKPWAKKALYGMVLVTFGYLLSGTIATPDLWVDPLGPFVKTIPAALLALVATRLVETR